MSAPSSAMLDVRALARTLAMQPVDLVRALVGDGVEVLQVSSRGYRVDGTAFAAWKEQRQQRLVQKLRQAERRADHVRGPVTVPKRRAAFTR